MVSSSVYSSTPTGLLWYTNISSVSLFRKWKLSVPVSSKPIKANQIKKLNNNDQHHHHYLHQQPYLTAELTNLWPSFPDLIGIWSIGFCGRRKSGVPGEAEEKPQSRDGHSTCDAGYGKRTRATAVGGERSYHCAIPASPVLVRKQNYWLSLGNKSVSSLISTE